MHKVDQHTESSKKLPKSIPGSKFPMHVGRGVPPHHQVMLQTRNGCPTIQLDSETIYSQNQIPQAKALCFRCQLHAQVITCILTNWLPISSSHDLSSSSKSQKRLKKQRKEGVQISVKNGKDNNKALEKKGTDANNIKIILKISPNLNFFPLICSVCQATDNQPLAQNSRYGYFLIFKQKQQV